MKYTIVEAFAIKGGMIVATEEDLKQLSEKEIKKLLKAGLLKERRTTKNIKSEDIEVR